MTPAEAIRLAADMIDRCPEVHIDHDHGIHGSDDEYGFVLRLRLIADALDIPSPQ